MTLHATLEIIPTMLVFDGHFPGAPVLPGIIQLQIIRKLLEKHFNTPLQLQQITKAKMAKMILPNDIVDLEVTWFPLPKAPQNNPLPLKALFKKEGNLLTRLQLAFKQSS